LVVATFCVALLVRWLYIDSIRGAAFFEHLQTNALRYRQWAGLIVDGMAAPRPPFDQAPGYAYFLALVFSFGGRSVLAVARVQACIDAATCATLALWARQWFGSRAGWVAAGLASLCAPLIYFSAEMLPATVALALVVAALQLGVARAWLASGLTWAVSLLFRSEAALALPFVAFDAWRRGGRAALRSTLAPAGLLLLISLATNAALSGHLVPLTVGGGLNLWLGNNPQADGVNPFLHGELARTAASLHQAEGDAVATDRAFAAQALGFALRQPLATAGLAVKKLLWTLNNRELPNTSDIEWQTAQSWMFWPPLFPLGLGWLLPPALAGMIAARRRAAELCLGAAPLAIGLGTCVLFFTNARFRLPLLPVLLCFAAYWLAHLSEARRRGFDKPSLIGLIVGLILAWGNFYDVRNYQVPEIDVNTGILLRETHDYGGAVQFLERGLAAHPGDGIAWVHLALAHEQIGMIDRAIDAYLDGLQRVPDFTDLRTMAERCLARHAIPTHMLAAFVDATDDTQRQAVRTAIHAARPPVAPVR